MEFREFIKQAAHVKPSANQLRMLRETPFYGFAHFSPNTYTDLEWGNGTEDPAIFNPTELDCEQWAKAFKSAGMKGMVLTCKHHDGFCLWPSKYTEHSVKNSPYKNGKGDIVREASDACRKYGLKFGVYLSLWDRNCPIYGTDEYNDFYCGQLTELLSNYGEIFHVWFDGACGEGPNGRKQKYDFDRYLAIIKKLQPNATVFNDAGSIRYCGNEAGRSPYAQWAVVPKELAWMNETQTGAGPLADCGSLNNIDTFDIDLGGLSNIIYSKGLVFAPAETDMSIRNGWFWHEKEEPHSLERLFDTYIRTVGGTGTFHLNVPPTRKGLLDERDVKRLAELGEMIKTSFEKNIFEDAKIVENKEEGSDTRTEFVITMPEKRTVKFIELAENIAEGQRIESFKVYYKMDNGTWMHKTSATTVGSKKIIDLRSRPIESDTVRIYITAARDTVDMEYIKAF